MQSGLLPWHIILLQARQSLIIALTWWLSPLRLTTAFPVITDRYHPATPGRAGRAWVNEIKFHNGFKYPSKNIINNRLAGMQSGLLPWHIILLQSNTESYHGFDTVHCPMMPHANQPMPHLEKCWPSQDLNLVLSTFLADDLTTDLLNWADQLMSNLQMMAW